MKTAIIFIFLQIIIPFNLHAEIVDINIDHIGTCDGSNSGGVNQIMSIEQGWPIAILVHGVNARNGGFFEMSEAIIKRGITPLCFYYDDRDDLSNSAYILQTSITSLIALGRPEKILLIAHSMGGLVARKSVTESSSNINFNNIDIELITASTPFGGIKSSRTCNSTFWKIASLGISSLICKMISGDKWDQLSPYADFIKYPGTLLPNVTRHDKIITDEQGFCLTWSKSGKCLTKDYAFSIKEQKNEVVDDEAVMIQTVVKSGHTKIITDDYLMIVDML